ncbi:superinfection immunity protein [Brucella anthropi]|uniref:superinfection immunity protein n=1 Tax=Brucella anthropi TaxID=529 RepID=UPI00124DE6E1|nr:superinfection immunity protein [Brucella anthropi]KAB2800001.1 superinfection immunity protein [Brucella anthropi]
MGKHLRSLQRQLPLFGLSSTITLAFSERAWAGQGDMQTALLALAFIAAIVVILAVIFIPTIVAFRRQHPNRWLIFVVNLAFGGTIVGWVAALVWAMHYAYISEDGSNGGESGINLFVNDPVTVHVDPNMNDDQNSVLTGGSTDNSSPSSDHSDAESIRAIRRLKALFESGAISAEEYTALKAPILNSYIHRSD